MNIATPEQKHIFRRRRVLATLGIIGIGIGGLFLLMGLFIYKRDMSFVIVFGTMLVTGLVSFLCRLMIFRCPICGRPISNRYAANSPFGNRNTFGTRCEKCDFDFAA